MSATLLYRIAAVLLVFFGVGHTFGFLNFKPPTPEGLAVLDAMNNVHFQVKGTSFSYGGFYIGFGLFVTVYSFFSAFLAWHLGSVARKYPQTIVALGWSFFAVQVVNLALALVYFFREPALFGAVIAACVGLAAQRSGERIGESRRA